jgi:hypothetical protein
VLHQEVITMGFEVRLGEERVETVEADSYRQEGPLVTFYRLEAGRRVIDCWAIPVASFRSAAVNEIVLRREYAA